MTSRTFALGPWVLRVDPEATAEAYEQMASGGADSCGCEACRNWCAARDDHLPSPFRDLLDSLGVDATKDVEVYEVSAEGRRGVLYGGWYALVGRVVSGPGASTVPSGRRGTTGCAVRPLHDIGAGVQVGFASGCDLAPCAFEAQELASLEFSLTVPWRLHR